jgi:hypothetical protein
MNRRSHYRAAVGTAAALAIALSVQSTRLQRERMEAARAARAVIRQQLAAFNRDDYRAAYGYAAPEIQEQFPLPAFRQMVRRGYPQIAHSRATAFGPARFHGSVVAVPILVTGEDGMIARYIYLLRRVKEEWRVAGVEGSSPPGASPPGRPQEPEEPPHAA